MSKPKRAAPRLSLKSIEAWELRHQQALRAALSKAEREVRAGKGTVFDPMKPGALLKRVIGASKRRRAA